MRILAIVPSVYDTSPGQRFRIEQWEPWLRQSGIKLTYAPFESEELHAVLYKPGHLTRKMHLVSRSLARRLAMLRSIRDYDAVYVFREAALLGPAFIERWICRFGVPLIFDFDDAIFVPNVSDANRLFGVLKSPSKTRTICRLASHVMAGNAYLADYARQVNPQVTIIPTTIDTEKYQSQQPKPESDPLVIGWSGSRTTVQHLNVLRQVLQRLATQRRFRLRVIGTPEYELDGVDVIATQWRSKTEVEDLREIDIGIMPLPDDSWARGKCGLKALQYMALGIPTICSPVGVNSEIIADGENGFLAGTEDEWVDKLTRLLESAQLRSQIGLAGCATVEERYSASVQAPRVSQIFESVIRGAEARGISAPVGKTSSIA